MTRQTTDDSGDSGSNRSSSATPTNPFLPRAHIDSIRWDIIPEESECSTNRTDDQADSSSAEIFNLTTSEESKARYETIRSNMLENANVTMDPLGIDIDPVRPFESNRLNLCINTFCFLRRLLLNSKITKIVQVISVSQTCITI